MRLQSTIRRLGYFWLPETPERRIAGELVISDGGNIELRLFAPLHDTFDALKASLASEHLRISRINGEVECDGFVTLERCFYTKQTLSNPDLSPSTVYVTTAFIGVGFDANEKIELNSFNFTVEGLELWIGRTWRSLAMSEGPKVDGIRIIHHEPISVQLANGMRCTIRPRMQIKSSDNNANVNHSHVIELESDQLLPLDAFRSVAFKIVNLIVFGLDKCVAIMDVKGTTVVSVASNPEAAPVQETLAIYYQSIPFPERPPKIARHHILFGFADIEPNLENILNNWLQAYDRIGPSLHLFLSVKNESQEFVEQKFLALVQGLETYHRRTTTETLMSAEEFENVKTDLLAACPKEHRDWLDVRLTHANELPLRKRLRELFEQFEDLFGSRKEISMLVGRTVDTRNYLTHYEAEGESKAADGNDLRRLRYRLEVLFQLLLLGVLGFSYAEVLAIFKRSLTLQERIKP